MYGCTYTHCTHAMYLTMSLDRQASIEQFSINVPVSKFFFPQTFSISQADRFNWEPFFFPCQRRGIAHFTKKEQDRQNFWGKHDFPSIRYMTKRILSVIKTIHSKDFFAPSRYFIQVHYLWFRETNFLSFCQAT